MNTKAVMDRAHRLAVDYIRQQYTEPVKVSVLADAVRKELENDGGVWLRRAMEELE